jgi:DNA-binding PadR family transcriptional regulator
MALTENRFRKRLKGRCSISSLEEKKDFDNVQRILKLLIEQGSLKSNNLRKLLCKPQLGVLTQKKSISSKRLYQYLSWLKNNGYISKEKRKSPYELTQKGLDYWASKSLRETIQSDEHPEVLVLKIITEYVRIDREKRTKEIMPKFQEYAETVNKEVLEGTEKLWKDMFDNLSEQLGPAVDQQYREKVKQLRYEVVGDWIALKKSE